MIEVHRVKSDPDKITMEMTENGEVLCVASASIDGNTAILEYIKENQKNFAYDMGKAILNAIDLQGIHMVKSTNKELEKTLKMLQFKENDDTYILDLTGYFTSC